MVWYHSSKLQAGCERPSSCWGRLIAQVARDGANCCRQFLSIIALGHLAASRHGKRLGVGTFPHHLWPATPQPKSKFLYGHLNNIKTGEDSLQPKACWLRGVSSSVVLPGAGSGELSLPEGPSSSKAPCWAVPTQGLRSTAPSRSPLAAPCKSR